MNPDPIIGPLEGRFRRRGTRDWWRSCLVKWANEDGSIEVTDRRTNARRSIDLTLWTVEVLENDRWIEVEAEHED